MNPLSLFPSKFVLNPIRRCYIPRRSFIFSTNSNFITLRGIATTVSRRSDEEHVHFSRKKRIPKSDGEWQGKLLPTTSPLFKLIIPLPKSIPPLSENAAHVVYLLHPSQPLSHISSLIAASLASTAQDVNVSFRSVPPDDSLDSKDVEVEWSDATNLGDFIKSVVSQEHFDVVISPKLMKAYDECKASPLKAEESSGRINGSLEDADARDPRIITVTVEVPSFQDRTRFLRRRLQSISMALSQMEPLKQECDREAHRGARRLAVGGFGMLVTYWFGVARLTFYDYGWDVMEPITYLSGLSTVICGYLWFLYKGREVSYTSVLSQSVSARRLTLYKARGFDLERWADLIAERKSIRLEVNKIAEDYDIQWDGQWEDESHHHHHSGTKNEEKEQEKEEIKEQTVQSDTESPSDVGKSISVQGDHNSNKGFEKLEELDREADQQRQDDNKMSA